jgi:hypothetical protein
MGSGGNQNRGEEQNSRKAYGYSLHGAGP